MDNSTDSLELLSLLLKNRQYKISTCKTVDSLFSNLQYAIPDLIIIDIWHYDVNEKVSICKDLRTRNALKDVPILITSTNVNHIKNYKDYCANDGLEKPFELDDLMNKVESLLTT